MILLTKLHKVIVKIVLCIEILKQMPTFRPAATGLDHSCAIVACDLTQILAEGSGCKLNLYHNFDSWISTYKFERQNFRYGRRNEPKFGTHVRIDTLTLKK